MNILVVDDDATTQSLLEKSLTKWGYDVFKADNGRQAIEILNDTDVDMIISDWLMPKMNGLELCAKVRSLDFKHYIYIILISAQNTRTDVVLGLEGGVDDYITKPLNLDELRARMEIGVRVVNLERELNQKYLTIKRNYYQSIHMFTKMLEVYNKALGSHSRRVGQLSLNMAKLHPEVLSEDYPVIEAAGLLHDIGLIGLPDALVTKSPIALTGDEKDLYRSHPERGEMILNQVDLLRPVAKIVRMHHEQRNGRGFPDGLQNDQILIGAALVGAASMYDNLVHRDGIPLDNVSEHLQTCRGYQLEPELVDMLLEINLSQIQEEAQRTYREIGIDDLKAGMVLTQDIRMKTGAFVMAADTTIDAAMITKLKRCHELGSIIDKIFIKK